MAAIVGESLFFEVSRVLRNNYRISYYQHQSLVSFIEMLTLHDRAILFIGDETDDEFIETYDWMINTIHETTDFKINIVLPKNRNTYISPDIIERFEAICDELYPHPLGITTDDLFAKLKKDRTSEDMSERIERVFCEFYPEFNSAKFAEGIYTIWMGNANSSELLYFFRAHLFQAIAEATNATPIFENQRLIAAALQQSSRPNSRVGTLPFTIYKVVDNLLAQASSQLPVRSREYPRSSLLLSNIVSGVTDTSRYAILNKVFTLRSIFKSFRDSYRNIENILTDPNRSLYDRSGIKTQLEQSVSRVWLPLISSLGHDYSSNAIKKIGKKVFEKYGVGELKMEHESKGNNSESSTNYSTPSLFGVGTAVVQTVTEVYRDHKLAAPNRALLDVLMSVVKLDNATSRISELLPVRDFRYPSNQLLDSLLIEKLVEVSK